MIKSILTRFGKGAVAGAVASMALVSLGTPSLWSDFSSIFNALGVAALSGAMTGLLLALQKWASWQE